MARNVINMAVGLPDNPDVKSGIRTNIEVLIYIDVARAMAAGIPFFRSANNVICSPGPIPLEFFAHVVRRTDNAILYEQSCEEAPDAAAAAAAEATGGSSRRSSRSAQGRQQSPQKVEATGGSSRRSSRGTGGSSRRRRRGTGGSSRRRSSSSTGGSRSPQKQRHQEAAVAAAAEAPGGSSRRRSRGISIVAVATIVSGLKDHRRACY